MPNRKVWVGLVTGMIVGGIGTIAKNYGVELPIEMTAYVSTFISFVLSYIVPEPN